MHLTTGASLLSLPWAPVLQTDYDEAATRCEIPVNCANPETHKQIVRSLRYDKSKRGARGRALTTDLPHLGLLKGDRLEPSEMIPDVGGGFDRLTIFPVLLVFRRSSLVTVCHHRNPLFDSAIYIRVGGAGDVLLKAQKISHRRVITPMRWRVRPS